MKETGNHHHLQRKKEKETHDDLRSSPNWLNLHSDPLDSIVNRVFSSIPDLLSLSAVSKSWRSLVKSSFLSVSPAPLLLSPLTDFSPKRSSMSLLKTLTPPNPAPRTYRSSISKKALIRNCCGYSHGHLIFVSKSKYTVLIADLFSSTRFRLPKPPIGSSHFSHGILTAPPSSSSSMLILISLPKILCCRLRADPCEDDWLFLGHPKVGNPPFSLFVQSLTLFNGTLHFLYSDGTLFALEFVPCACWKQLPNTPPCDNTWVAYMRLAECDGNLLLLRFLVMDKYQTYRVEVYKMDFGEGVWARVESIGDWCLFMDYVGKCPLACRNPGKWGGRSNCVYLTGLRSGRWSVLPMDGSSEFEHGFHFKTWPTSLWAYPSKIL